MSSAVTLERYAEIRAEMDAGVLRDEALARAGVTTDEWTVTQREWLEKMGTELDRGRFELSNRYSQAFLERQRAILSVAAPRVAAEVASPSGGATGIAQPGIAPSAQPPAAALPSYLKAPVIQTSPQQGALPSVSRAPAALVATGSFVAPRGPSLPFAKAPPGGAPIASPLPPPASPKPKPSPKSELGGTSFAIDNSAMRAALPFAGAGPAKPAAEPAVAPPAPAPPLVAPKTSKPALGGTSFAIDNSAMRAALPFGGAAPPKPDRAPSTTAPAAPPLPAEASALKPTAKPKLGGTSFAVDNSAMRAALPFAGGGVASKGIVPSLTGFNAAPPSSPSTASAPPRAAPPPLPAKAKAPAVGETSMALDIPREALPFPNAPAGDSAKPAAKVTLTLEQYASVCAEIAVAPGTEDAIRKKYSIPDEGAWKALDNQWQAKFLFDAAARKKWLDLTEQYRRWLLAQPR